MFRKESVVDIFDEMRSMGECTDASIRVRDTVFKIHKVIMSSCSMFFRSLFSSRWACDGKASYDFPEVSPVTMSLIIQYAYTGLVPITETNVKELLLVADKYLVSGVVDACCLFLVSNLSSRNCISIYRFTEIFCVCWNVHLKAKIHILMNFEEVCRVSEEFLELSLEHLLEFIGQDDLIVKHEENVFEAVLQWINHRPGERQNYVGVLLPMVRMGFMSMEYFMNNVRDHPLFMWNESCVPTINSAMQALFHVNIDGPSSPELMHRMTRPRLPPAVLLAIGGWSSPGPTNRIEAYDIKANCWVDVTEVDEHPRAYHGSVLLDGFVYCIGGFDGIDYFNSVRKWNLTTHTWHEVAPMYERRCYVSVAVLNGYIYAIGGFDGQTRLRTAERYNPQSNQWMQIAPMNDTRSDANITTLHGKVYICGGFSGRECLFTAECFDPQTNQWSLINPMFTRRSGVRTVAYGNLIYAVGGFDGFNRLNSVEVYDPQTNRWHDVQPMIKPRSNFGIAVLDDHIFVVGGFNGRGTFGEVECYDPQTNTWRMVCTMAISRSALSCCVLSGLPYVGKFTANRDLF